MQQRTLGPFTVSAIGLGAMPLSMNSDNAFPTREEAIATVHAALDAGVTLIDTADIYAPSWDQVGVNEEIVGAALASWSGDRSSIVVATKGGITRTAEKDFGRNGSLGYLRGAVDASRRRLGVDVIDLYQYHRPDRTMVYADTMRNLKALYDEGTVRALGVSNANVEEIAIAQEVLGEALVSVQNEFSPRHPFAHVEQKYCAAHGLAFLPWSPLGGTGGPGREVGERFGVFAEIGAAHGVSPQQAVLAWELSLGTNVIPIPGARRAASIVDSAKAADLVLSTAELDRASAAVGLEF